MPPPLLVTIRDAASRNVWAHGQALHRQQRVLIDAASADTEIFRVVRPGQIIAARVSLWPSRDDWLCDCEDAEDPCSHVVAAVLHREQQGQETERSPSAAKRALPWRVAYRFVRQQDALHFSRELFRENERKSLSQSLFDQTLSSLVASTKQDIDAEQALVGRLRGGRLPAVSLGLILDRLVGCSHVFLDQRPVSIGSARSIERLIVDQMGKEKDPSPSFGARRSRGGSVSEWGGPCGGPTLSYSGFATFQAGKGFAVSRAQCSEKPNRRACRTGRADVKGALPGGNSCLKLA